MGTEVKTAISEECDDIKALLLEKNRSYGNSALDPLRIFSKSLPEEGIRVRIDDKLSRIQRGVDNEEDTVLDLIGYLVLLRVSRRLAVAEHDTKAGELLSIRRHGQIFVPTNEGHKSVFTCEGFSSSLSFDGPSDDDDYCENCNWPIDECTCHFRGTH